MNHFVIALVAMLLLACGLSREAQAQQSHYTKAGGKACKILGKGPEGPWIELECPGRAGYVVRIFDADDRTRVTIASSIREAQKQDNAMSNDRFISFNYIDEKIEWRSRRGKPYAVIQHWFLHDSARSETGEQVWNEFVVVSRLEPMCRVATIDVAANPDHKALARKIADEQAPSFKCKVDQPFEAGEKGAGAGRQL